MYVLRDATAKALYGSQAANGVIVIETKRGKKGEKYIKANGEFGFQMVNQIPEYLDSYQYATAFNQAQINDGIAETSRLYSAEDTRLQSSG